MSRTAFYRIPGSNSQRDAAVIAALNELVERKPRWGFWKCYDRMRLEGRPWNHKRVHRVYCAMHLNLPRRTKRRLPAGSVRFFVYVPGVVGSFGDAALEVDGELQQGLIRSLVSSTPGLLRVPDGQV
jgi:hypothetical protein